MNLPSNQLNEKQIDSIINLKRDQQLLEHSEKIFSDSKEIFESVNQTVKDSQFYSYVFVSILFLGSLLSYTFYEKEKIEILRKECKK